MHTRGRSRDISPIAIVRASLDQHKAHPEISVNYALTPHGTDSTSTATPRTVAHPSSARPLPRMYLAAEQPMASSSRLEPPPQLSSSASSASSLDHTQAPSTPPMYTNDVYTVHYDNDPPLDYYDSPPSPPRTLQDQMQVAYALDNMHLAKVLLLKLKGIEVTGDQDPRIAQVKDEDFSETFVPRGGLKMTQEAEERMLEGQRRERERRRRIAREERLRVCERIWEDGACSYQEARARAARKKVVECRARRLADLEARERDRERNTRGRESAQDSSKSRRTTRTTCGVPRPILSYDTLPASHSRQMSTSRSPPQREEPVGVYEYTLMRTTVSTSVSSQSRSKPKSPNTAYRELTALSSTNVPFCDVVSSMQGTLFQEEDITPCKRGKTLGEIKLLETLLEPAPWALRDAASDRLAKGKARATGDEDCLACAEQLNCATSEASSSSSSSAVTVARSTSWFSFSSRKSTSTAATTPSSSPMSIKVFQPLPRLARDSSSPRGSTVKHSCRRPHVKRLSSVPLDSSENPLASPSTITSVSSAQADNGCGSFDRGRSTSCATDSTRSRSPSTDTAMFLTSTAIVARMSRSVSTFIDMAAQLQRAYVKATMYTANPDIYFTSPDSRRSRSRSRSSSHARSVTSSARRRERGYLRPQGYRASCDDVLTFISVDASEPQPTQERPLIPLSQTRPSSADAPRVFPATPSMPRSPFRPAQPPTCLTSRLRPIANPLLLRLRALHNLYDGATKDVLEVREKVVGVAWEGIGRSGLVWEVKPTSS